MCMFTLTLSPAGEQLAANGLARWTETGLQCPATQESLITSTNRLPTWQAWNVSEGSTFHSYCASWTVSQASSKIFRAQWHSIVACQILRKERRSLTIHFSSEIHRLIWCLWIDLCSVHVQCNAGRTVLFSISEPQQLIIFELIANCSTQRLIQVIRSRPTALCTCLNFKWLRWMSLNKYKQSHDMKRVHRAESLYGLNSEKMYRKRWKQMY